ncbi:amidohydrolase family protein [Ornithinibacillus sp. 4-3]|uniref:Amidohydrolase family protein n=1 Tax=Ornithinibacillus sp. 4-3 TaxID=3231488 RepID=A0AB39HS77_9BACI
MTLNFDHLPFFDHHTHLLFTDKTKITAKELSMNFLHGYQDMDPFEQGLDATYAHGRASERQLENIENLGVVKTVVNYMSQFLGCEPTIEAVVEARNERIKDVEGLKKYTKDLYEDQNIVGTLVDWPFNEDVENESVFPVPVYRMYNYEDVYFEQLKTASSFEELMTVLTKSVRKAINEDGYIALKCHVAEHYTMAVRNVTDEEAAIQFVAAQNGDYTALENVYFAAFRNLMFEAQDLDVPIHIHVGSTGFNRQSAAFVPEMDPFQFAPFLVSDPQYVKTKIVLLHQGYPYTRHASLMAYSFPNVYVDMSWTLPWASSIFCSCIEDVLSTAPHTKIFFGTGQHGLPEIAWTASKVAKTCLAEVMNKMVSLNLMAPSQAEETAKMLLYKNAEALYDSKKKALSNIR